jgi:hypothetical protein
MFDATLPITFEKSFKISSLNGFLAAAFRHQLCFLLCINSF